MRRLMDLRSFSSGVRVVAQFEVDPFREPVGRRKGGHHANTTQSHVPWSGPLLAAHWLMQVDLHGGDLTFSGGNERGCGATFAPVAR